MTRLPKINCEKGTAVVESTVIILTVVTIIALLLGAMYLTFAKVWIHHSGYKGLICAAQGQSLSVCKELVEKKLHAGLPIGKAEKLALYPKRGGWRVFIKWKLAGQRELKYSKSLRYEK